MFGKPSTQSSPFPPSGLGQWKQLATSGEGPCPRSGHDVVVMGNKAYVFGGCGGFTSVSCLADIHTFDLETHQWDLVNVKGDVAPLPRASFGMCAGPRPGTIIVAGGTGVEVDSLRADIMEYDSRTNTWRTLVVDSERTPCKFYGQSVCSYGDSLLLFGGSTGLHYANDLYEYNVVTTRWRKLPTTGAKPSPRYKHQGTVVGDSMYVIGGGCFKPEQSSIDVHRLCLKTLVWEVVATSGDVPKSRVAHTCSYDAASDTIYLWGGFTSELSRLQDFFALHCATATWRDMLPPAPLSCADAAAADGGDAQAEAEAERQQRAPAAEGAAAAAACGGSGAGAAPPARAFHAAAVHAGALHVFSGANGDTRYADVWRYQLRVAAPPALGVLAAHALRAAGAAHWRAAARALPRELAQCVVGMNDFADAPRLVDSAGGLRRGGLPLPPP